MTSPSLLLQRLHGIADSLRSSGSARALLALGSVGTELGRLDNYSDLDFFVITKRGMKQHLIGDLSWLSSIAPLSYHFQNTKDGHKVLFGDGIYCEFAVFEEEEMKSAVFSAGRIVWKEDDFDETLCVPSKPSAPFVPENLDWAVGEALTCIYVGLCRYARGEKLSGTRFIQSYAVDMIVSCSSYFVQEQPDFKDEFQHERRYEKRYPSLAKFLPSVLQGYERCPESALALLAMMEELIPAERLNGSIRKEIVTLAETLIEERNNNNSLKDNQ
jgi:lincosamide nucleotidyltransferase